jgi:hypothetical protein
MRLTGGHHLSTGSLTQTASDVCRSGHCFYGFCCHWALLFEQAIAPFLVVINNSATINPGW